VIPVEVTQAPWHYTTFWDWLDHWQSLAAGLVAVVAAIIAIGGAELFARLRERRERKAILLSLAVEVRAYLFMFIKTCEILQALQPEKALVHQLRSVAELPSPIVFSASADRIGLLGPRIAAGLADFYVVQEALNSTVRFFAVDSARAIRRDSLDGLALLFEQACSRALPLLAKLPREEADATLKKTIESFAANRGTASSASPPGP
jgi:hypothetical protein